ncbi:tRNA lysidine(34) synthetase TilS [Catenovulum sp. 2E275]|uniref:tRNA lysidine(34) synthetase TilS n=1 Tax=Catenovulum sp. 2E275 TaxID=2980497 RepID=UPI0021D01BE2|nr:tRNA lysidine(34) synthetase TilS [Catenovulum sp. 2E275]MCU4675727.1 tRNA lysidine(34) synthetase TilS [Catenovulum sp. 2E275]
MNMLLNKTELDQLKQFASEQRPLVVGLSGGVDSIVLLDCLIKNAQQLALQINLSAIHIHHGLSKNADHWLAFCRDFCQQRNIAFQFKKVNLNKQNRQSLEALARAERYQAFEQLTLDDSVLITAQHLNDQAETVLLRLKRGSGPAGLGAMARLRKLSELPVFGSTLDKDEAQLNTYTDTNKLLWRPLLKQNKAAILAYAKQHHLSWVEDESNLNDDFERNFLRNQVLPLIETRWPEFQKCIARSAELCQQEQDILKEVAIQDLALAQSSNPENHAHKLKALNQLDLTVLAKLSIARQTNLLRYWLQSFSEPMPSQAVIQQILTNIGTHVEQQPKVSLQLGELWQYKNKLFYFTQAQVNGFATIAQDITLSPADLIQNNQTQINLSNGQNCTINWQQLGIQIKAGDTIKLTFNPSVKLTCRPKYRNCTKTIKQCLQELAVPVWLRPHIPYLWVNGQLKAAIGYWECE